MRPYRVLEQLDLAELVESYLADVVDDGVLDQVLDKLEGEMAYIEIADVEARNADHAKKLAGAKIVAPEPRESQLWAIPDRNWNMGPVNVHTTTRVSTS